MTSSSVGSNALILEVLNRTNYETWRQRVETFLLAEDLWQVVEAIEPTNPEVSEDEYKAWRIKNAKALYAIQNSCGPTMFPFIKEKKTAKGAWDALAQEGKIGAEYVENNVDHLMRHKSFTEYVRSGDWDEAKKCLGEIDIRSVLVRPINKKGDTTIHVAAREGHAHMVKELSHLMTQEDLQRKTTDGHTALHLAAEKGHVHVVKELWVHVVKELRVQLMGELDSHGDTALHIAIQKGKVDIVKELVLLMRQNDLKIKNDAGYTALHLAVNKGNVPMVKEFVRKEQGEKSSPEDDFCHYIPFTTYLRNGDLDLANMCLRELDDPYGAIARINPRDKRGDTALHLVVWSGHVHTLKEWVSLLKVRQEHLELKTSQDFIDFGSRIGLGVSEDLLMEKAEYMVEQYEKLVATILELTNAEGYTALQLAVMKGDVDIVKELVPLMRQEGLEIRGVDGAALHLAARFGHLEIVMELIRSTRLEALEEKDSEGYTALNSAIQSFNDGELCQIVQYMARKNDKVLSIRSAPNDNIPVITALCWRKWESARYMYSITPPQALKGPDGSSFICYCLNARETIDLAWDLLQRCPDLAFTINTQAPKSSPMLKLSRMRFLGGERIDMCWKRWLYNCICVPEAHVNIQDISIAVAESKDGHSNKKDLISSVISILRRFAKGLRIYCGIQHIYEMKSTHRWISQFLQCMGKATETYYLTPEQDTMVKKSIFEAIEIGHFEFVTKICEANPKLLDIYDEKGRSIFHVAIENRQQEVYNLIHAMPKDKRDNIATELVNFDNTMLHFAANLSSRPQSDHVRDSSLQVQRELQWFKEVKRIVPMQGHEDRNRSDGLTPRELFTRNHKKLVEDAESSTKSIAASCTVVGALIVTMMFAAAFTVPDGNNDDTGLPMLLKKKLFKVFIVSDTISLAFSMTSVISFLGILTSRFAEDDFLLSLPTKMMFGLFTLFCSIVTMMITFSCALVIVVDGEASIVIPSILLASIPVITFLWLLFPLLGEMFMSTYGPGIFKKQSS